MKNNTIGMIWIIMPVYNEEEAAPGVIKEWSQQLEALDIDYTFCALNDGSKDSTLAQLKQCQATYPNIKIVDKKNTGHGQTCVTGYEMALENGAEWIFQIDSDGQCDPQYFPDLLKQIPEHKAVFGYRRKRDDGMQRFLISRVVSFFTLAATGVWVKDANVPYRLIHRDIMAKAVPLIPKDFHLANIFLSVLVRKQTPIQWVDIRFRDRTGGSPSVKTFSFFKHGTKLFKQLRKAVKNIEHHGSK